MGGQIDGWDVRQEDTEVDTNVYVCVYVYILYV